MPFARSQPGLTSLARTLQQLEKDRSRVQLYENSSRLDLKNLSAHSTGHFSLTKDVSDLRSPPMSPPISPREQGDGFDFVVEALDDSGKQVSYWHDLPLYVSDEEKQLIPFHVNFINEIPRCTRKKFEVSTKLDMNPIKQDVKKGVLREYKKDPGFIHPDVGVAGDNDPLDACEIGLRLIPTGEVRAAKVLGCLCMIDEEEADWKLIVIDATDPWAKVLDDIGDVEDQLPGMLDQIREWWRTYKVPDGKPLNRFGFDEKFMDRRYAMDVIEQAHEAWRKKFTPAVAG
eukprot:TRINITY_DN24849_c0_g1_i2.p1 TRINITY_DN24849_c0_g1~~TRINITY_DN24849_c0_g1_i2.p1  ORF type:complete len:297 (-),score=46.03 TRINITY_DN24849_c0_g1_i2:53-913(-)